MTKEKLEIDKVIPYKRDMSAFPNWDSFSYDMKTETGLHDSMVEITYKNTKKTTNESADYFVRKALHNAILKKDDSLLKKVIEFGIAELLSVPELREQFLSYIKEEYKNGGKTSSEIKKKERMKVYDDVKKYLNEGYKLAGDQGSDTALNIAGKENNISFSTAREHYYVRKAELDLIAKTNAESLGGAGVFLAESSYDEKVKVLIDKQIKKRKAVPFDSAIKKVSLEMMMSEDECRRRYKRASK
jgi:hypothetical protein